MPTGIRQGFVETLRELEADRRRRARKAASVYFRISERYDYDLSQDELRMVADLLGYQPGWAYHKGLEQPTLRATWLAQKAKRAAPEGWHDTWTKYAEQNARARQNASDAYEKFRRRHEGAAFGDGFAHRQAPRSSPLTDALNLFGLKPHFTEEELKKAYRRYVMIHHPDRGGKAEEFQKGVKANELLGPHATKESEEAPF